MSIINTNYKQYIEETYSLARSLVIKNEHTAKVMNERVELLGHTVSSDPTTWRYYLNLSGTYHVLDEPMYVVSLDTKETILLTVDNLKIHPITKREYMPSKKAFKSLVKQYPGQELLLRGIFNPCDINVAVNAPDYSVLSYEREYLKEQEVTLIWDLDTRIKDFGSRWNNPSYNFIDDLYHTAHLAILFTSLPNWLMELRLARVKTNEVHDFHIKEYLRSNGKLDKYYEYLTLNQKLFLYRNLKYINRNVGKEDTFGWLTQKMLTERYINLSEHNVKLNTKDLLETRIKGLDVYRSNLNGIPNTLQDKRFSFRDALEKERNYGVENILVEEETIIDNTPTITNSYREKYTTKMLESVLRDLSDGGVYVFSKELIWHWGYMAFKGNYIADFRFINTDNGTGIDVDTKEAFMLLIVLNNLKAGIALREFPKIRFREIYGFSNPEREELESIVPEKAGLDTWVDWILSNRDEPTILVQNYTFAEHMAKVHRKTLSYRRAYAQVQEFDKRAQLETLLSTKYLTEVIDTAEEFNFSTVGQWLDKKGVDFENISAKAIDQLIKDIVVICTGFEYVETFNLAGMQKAMLSIMAELSSYHVQYIQDTNAAPIPYWEWLSVRGGDVNARNSDSVSVDMFDKIIQDVKQQSKDRVFLDMDKPPLRNISSDFRRDSIKLDLTIDQIKKEKRVTKLRMPISDVYVRDVIHT